MYKKFDKVKFIYKSEVKVGKLVGWETGHWWIQVKEPFSYQIPIESHREIINWFPMFSPYIDYYTPNGNILGLAEEEENIATA
jgi:hypothetical protein